MQRKSPEVVSQVWSSLSSSFSHWAFSPREKQWWSLSCLSTAHLHGGSWVLRLWGYLLDRVACAKISQNGTTSHSKEVTADDFKITDFTFDLNYTVLFSRATKKYMLNSRGSAKGSTRYTSSWLNWTKSQGSHGETTVTRSDITLFLPPILPETLRQEATDKWRFMSPHKSQKEKSEGTVFQLIAMSRISLFFLKHTN